MAEQPTLQDAVNAIQGLQAQLTAMEGRATEQAARAAQAEERVNTVINEARGQLENQARIHREEIVELKKEMNRKHNLMEKGVFGKAEAFHSERPKWKEWAERTVGYFAGLNEDLEKALEWAQTQDKTITLEQAELENDQYVALAKQGHYFVCSPSPYMAMVTLKWILN